MYKKQKTVTECRLRSHKRLSGSVRFKTKQNTITHRIKSYRIAGTGDIKRESPEPRFADTPTYSLHP